MTGRIPGLVPGRESALTRSGKPVEKKMSEAPEPEDKLDATATVVVNGPEDAPFDWRQVDWRRVEDDVRRLRRRIFTASKAGDLRKVRSLQKLMLRSRANTLISVRRVTERNAGRLTAGVDGEVVLTPEAKARLAERVHQMTETEPFKAFPVSRVYIPKRGSSTKRRPLGIPVIADRCHQARVAGALEPEWEARFEPRSYGFRPGRGCHDAIQAVFEVVKGRSPKRPWVLDADLAGALEPSSHCLRVDGGGVEEAGFGLWEQYSQAFSASVADVEGLQLSALDTLQHGLAADAEDPHRVDDRNIVGWRFLDEQRAELVVDTDPPGRAGGVLLAADEAGLEPAEDRGGGDAEFVGGFADGEQFSVGRFGRRLVCGDLAVAAQAADDDCGEPLAAGGAAALAVEDPGDPAVVVVGGEPSDQLDRVLVGADRRLRLGERDRELGDRAAFPTDREQRAALLALEGDDHFLD